MTLLEIIRNRYSCRAYLDRAVEKEKLDRVAAKLLEKETIDGEEFRSLMA